MVRFRWKIHDLTSYPSLDHFTPYVLQKNSTTDGFFQRFLVSMPQEMFIKRNEKKKMMNEYAEKNGLKMEQLLKNIYRNGMKKKNLLVFSSEAERLYHEYHDSVVE